MVYQALASIKVMTLSLPSHFRIDQCRSFVSDDEQKDHLQLAIKQLQLFMRVRKPCHKNHDWQAQE